MASLLKPPTTRRLGGDSGGIAALPDGPVAGGRCTKCGGSFTYDIYCYRGVILCGDCRYFVRHGRWPSHDKTPGGNGTSAGAIIAAKEAVYHGLRLHSGE